MNKETSGIETAHNKFNLGNIPKEGHDYVGKFFHKLWEGARREKIDRLGMHDRWIDLHRQWRGKRKKKTFPVVGANYLFKTISGFCAILTEKHPQAEIQSDDAPEGQTKALEQETSEWWKEAELQKTLYASVQNMSVYGNTVEKGVFDLKTDTAKIDLRDPFNFFPAPGYTLCSLDIPYCCDAYFMPAWKIRQIFDVPEHIQISTDATEQLLGKSRETMRGGKATVSSTGTHLPSNYVDKGRGGDAQSLLSDQGLVIEMWIRDDAIVDEPVFEDVELVDDLGRTVGTEQQKVGTKQRPVYPDGIRKIVFCNNGDLVLDDSPNPNINWALIDARQEMLLNEGVPEPMVNPETGEIVIDATGQPLIQQRPINEIEARQIAEDTLNKTWLWSRFPFSVVGSQKDTTQWWAFAIIEQLEELQGKAESLLTKYFAYYDRVMFPILILPDGCGIDKSEVTNAPGLILTPTLSHAPHVRYVLPPNPPVGLLELLEFVLFQMDIISQTPEVTEGRRPKGISAASAIIVLRDKAATLFQPQIVSVDEIIRNRGRMFISFVQNFGTKEKPIRVDEEMVRFLGIDLQGVFKYVVESGSSAPITKAGRRQQYIELFKIQAMDLETLLKMLEIPRYEQVVERLAEQNSLPHAIDILIQAGMPEEEAKQLYMYLMQSQGGTGRKPEGQQKRPPAGGYSEGMTSAQLQRSELTKEG